MIGRFAIAIALLAAACGGSAERGVEATTGALRSPDSTEVVATPVATSDAPVGVEIRVTIESLPALQLCGSLGGCLHQLTLLRNESGMYLERRGLPVYVDRVAVTPEPGEQRLEDFGPLAPGRYLLIGTRQPVSDMLGGPDGPIIGSGLACSLPFVVDPSGDTVVAVDFAREGCTIRVGE